MSNCRSCGAEILWAVSEEGKKMPLDAAPSPEGTFIIAPNGSARFVGKLSASNDFLSKTRFVSHFATCPNAKQHRKAKAKKGG